MTKFARAILSRFWPEFDEQHPLAQVSVLGDTMTLLYAIPLSIVGLIWLVLVSKWSVVTDNFGLFVFLLLMAIVIEELDFYFLADIGNMSGGATFSGSFTVIITWTAALLLGPAGLWIAVFRLIIDLALRRRRQFNHIFSGIQQIRHFSISMADTTIISLIALQAYAWLGGEIPFPAFNSTSLWPAIVAISIRFIVGDFLSVPYLWYMGRHMPADFGTTMRDLLRFTLVTSIFSVPIQPFSILAAGIYSTGGWIGFVFFCGGLLLTGLLASNLSQAAGRSQQRTQELSQLEQLGRAIIEGPPDASTLGELLTQYAPPMFSQSGTLIRLFPDNDLVEPVLPVQFGEQSWDWLRTSRESGYCLSGDLLPWSKEVTAQATIVYAPILDTTTNKAIGGIFVGSIHPDRKGFVHWVPALQSLAAQIASALHSAEVYKQTLEHEKTTQELALAGRIQTSFLPEEVPTVQGWQLTASIEPARQTSGDFYDFIELPDNQLGILVADVADKGVGAALYMALSRTLIRTYAMEHPDSPAQALRLANDRILLDTQSDQFVTVFYGVLNMSEGTLTYCNAGHNPGYLVHMNGGVTVTELTRTGIPLGMFAGKIWRDATIAVEPSDLLVLYTDGLTEAHNSTKELFGEARLIEIISNNSETSAQDINTQIIQGVKDFRGSAPQFDDITLLMVRREKK